VRRPTGPGPGEMPRHRGEHPPGRGHGGSAVAPWIRPQRGDAPRSVPPGFAQPGASSNCSAEFARLPAASEADSTLAKASPAQPRAAHSKGNHQSALRAKAPGTRNTPHKIGPRPRFFTYQYKITTSNEILVPRRAQPPRPSAVSRSGGIVRRVALPRAGPKIQHHQRPPALSAGQFTPPIEKAAAPDQRSRPARSTHAVRTSTARHASGGCR